MNFRRGGIIIAISEFDSKFIQKEDAMKKNVSWLVFLVTVLGLGIVPALAGAQAVVIKDSSCIVLDVTGRYTFDVYDTVKVITQSKNANKNISCHGELPIGDTPPDKAIVLDYDSTHFRCCVNIDGEYVATLDWHETITPSGNVSLTCHFKGDDVLYMRCMPNGS
jgi:hypothetical protein